MVESTENTHLKIPHLKPTAECSQKAHQHNSPQTAINIIWSL